MKALTILPSFPQNITGSGFDRVALKLFSFNLLDYYTTLVSGIMQELFYENVFSFRHEKSAPLLQGTYF